LHRLSSSPEIAPIQKTSVTTSLTRWVKKKSVLSVRKEEVKEWTFWESDEPGNWNWEEDHNQCLVVQCKSAESTIIPRNPRSRKTWVCTVIWLWPSGSDYLVFTSTNFMNRKKR
jgi:hypothetical protein